MARAVDGPSMYEITARRAADEQERTRLRHMRMAELIRPADTVLRLDAPLADAAALFAAHPVKYVYLVDEAGRYRGVVAANELAARYRQHPDDDRATCAALLRPDLLPVVAAGMDLDDALRQFMRHHGERLPAVRADDDRVLLGVVTKTDVLDAFVRLNRARPGEPDDTRDG